MKRFKEIIIPKIEQEIINMRESLGSVVWKKPESKETVKNMIREFQDWINGWNRLLTWNMEEKELLEYWLGIQIHYDKQLEVYEPKVSTPLSRAKKFTTGFIIDLIYKELQIEKNIIAKHNIDVEGWKKQLEREYYD